MRGIQANAVRVVRLHIRCIVAELVSGKYTMERDRIYRRAGERERGESLVLVPVEAALLGLEFMRISLNDGCVSMGAPVYTFNATAGGLCHGEKDYRVFRGIYSLIDSSDRLILTESELWCFLVCTNFYALYTGLIRYDTSLYR